MLQNEVSSLKEQLADTKVQNEILQQDIKRHQEQTLLSLIQPDQDKKAQLEKEIKEEALIAKERLIKAEKEVEKLQFELH